jgi:hypothetical protein
MNVSKNSFLWMYDKVMELAFLFMTQCYKLNFTHDKKYETIVTATIQNANMRSRRSGQLIYPINPDDQLIYDITKWIKKIHSSDSLPLEYSSFSKHMTYIPVFTYRSIYAFIHNFYMFNVMKTFENMNTILSFMYLCSIEGKYLYQPEIGVNRRYDNIHYEYQLRYRIGDRCDPTTQLNHIFYKEMNDKDDNNITDIQCKPINEHPCIRIVEMGGPRKGIYFIHSSLYSYTY